jgi:hypothetical protein
MSIELTEEQRDQLKKQPNRAVTVVDSMTGEVFVLMQTEMYRHLIAQQPANGKVVVDYMVGLPPIRPGIRLSREAFLRDLPGLLADKALAGKWVLYRGAERIGVAGTEMELIRKSKELGLKDDEFWTDKVVPHAAEPEEIDL